MLTPVSTISAWPSATRRRTSASTSASARERRLPAHQRDHAEAAREGAAVLHLHERADPVARRRRRARPAAAEAGQQVGDRAGRLLRRRRDDVHAIAEVAQPRAGEARGAARDDDVAGAVGERAADRLAGLRDGLGRHRAAVHDVDVTARGALLEAVRREPLAQLAEVGLRDLAAEELPEKVATRAYAACPSPAVTGRSTPRRRSRPAGPCRTSPGSCRAPRRSRARSAARRPSAGRPTAARRARAR